jgi:hypothetical protein
MPCAERAEGDRVLFWCPGCDDAHAIGYGPGGWTWNGDLEKPTFTPSVKVTGTQWAPGEGFHKPQHHVAAGKPIVCHSFVTDGRISFLGDSTHTLAGQTVDLPEWPNLKEN